MSIPCYHSQFASRPPWRPLSQFVKWGCHTQTWHSPTLKISKQDMGMDGGKYISTHTNNKEPLGRRFPLETCNLPPSLGIWYNCGSRPVLNQSPFCLWASIHIPLPPMPKMTDAMFNALDKFSTKMQEADFKFMVFLHNLIHYRSLDNISMTINDQNSYQWK